MTYDFAASFLGDDVVVSLSMNASSTEDVMDIVSNSVKNNESLQQTDKWITTRGSAVVYMRRINHKIVA